jgi:hypothetical protein
LAANSTDVSASTLIFGHPASSRHSPIIAFVARQWTSVMALSPQGMDLMVRTPRSPRLAFDEPGTLFLGKAGWNPPSPGGGTGLAMSGQHLPPNKAAAQ